MSAQALGLGRLNVQSALGEGMRAEIELTGLSPEEAGSLQVRVAPPEAYRSAGIDYNAVLTSVHTTLGRRADGRPYLRVTSDRAVQEPFVEVILEVNSSSGKLVREFTLLFDPPGSRPAPPMQATAPVISPAPAPTIAQVRPAPSPQPATVTPRPAPAPARVATPAPTAMPARAVPPPEAPRTAAGRAVPPPDAPRAQAGRAVPPPPAPAAAARAATAGDKTYRVQPGDTLYRVAGRTNPAGISLDQMLVGLYRANPDAFIESNVNRLRAGAVLSVPVASEVSDVTLADARRLLTAQSADFSAYRARLAQGAPQAQAPEAGRAAQGKVQATVEDRKQSAAPSLDKLKLSGAAVQASAPQAANAQSKDNAARVAELTRNVEELKKLQEGTAAAQGGGPGASAAAGVAPQAGDGSAAAPTVAPASSGTLASAGGTGTGAGTGVAAPGLPTPPAPPAPVPAPAPAPAAAAEPSVIDGLTGSPWLLPSAGALALLLAGLAVWRLRGRARKTASETSFLESRMQPDSFFGASGGQRVDTRDSGNSHASNMGYSLSQLDAIGDVDPVAEADVYLAYGRDLQAEEILKEAMRATPERLAVRTKLLEVYAKRRDTKGFELLATQLYALTKGSGDDWAQAQALGLQIEPDNQLYQPGGHPDEIILDGERVVVEPLSATTQPHSLQAPMTEPMEDFEPSVPGELDLDLSFDDIDNGGAEPPMQATQALASGVLPPSDLGLDFDFDAPTLPSPRAMGAGVPPAAKPAVPATPEVPDLDLNSLTLDLNDLTAPVTVQGRAHDTTLDFSNFGASEAASLDEHGDTAPAGLADLDAADLSDPLARKLELADEFRQIGDMEGARDLLEEVVAKATGAMRARAQAMLDSLD